MRDGVRAWADQGHMSLQHVEQLRQFIQRSAANKATDCGDARVITAGLLHVTVIVNTHRAELPDLDHLAVPAMAILFENTGPGELIFTASAMISRIGLSAMIARNATVFSTRLLLKAAVGRLVSGLSFK